MSGTELLNAIKDLEKKLECGVCTKVLQEPLVVGKCGHTICKVCFHNDLGMQCPICEISLNTKDMNQDKQLSDLIYLMNRLKKTVQENPETVNKLASIAASRMKMEVDNVETTKGGDCEMINVKETSRLVQSKLPFTSQNSVIDMESQKNSFSSKKDSQKKRKRVSVEEKAAKKDPVVNCSKLNSTINFPIGNLEKKNHKGETPLQLAAIKGNIERVKELLGQGSNPNVKDNCGWSPLHEACLKGYSRIVQLLLDHGALINAPGYENRTPLHDAVINNRMDIARLLVSRGADVNARTLQGLTVLELCTTKEDRKALEKLSSKIGPNKIVSDVKISRKTDGRMVLLPTGLTETQKDCLDKCAEILKAEVVDEFSPSVTHIIAVCDENSNCTRTFKTLLGILSGKWIINYKWIEVMLEQKKQVDEDVYEVKGMKNQPNAEGPKRARENMELQNPPLFDGCYFYLYGQFTSPVPEHHQLCTLIHKGGGQVLCREPRQETVSLKSHMIPFHALGTRLEDTSHFIIYQDKPPKNIQIRSSHIYTVQVSWLIECISVFKMIDPEGVKKK